MDVVEVPAFGEPGVEGDTETELGVRPVVAAVVELRHGGAEVEHGAVQITQPLADRTHNRVPQLPLLRPEIDRRSLRGPVPHRTQDLLDKLRWRHPQLHQFRQRQRHLAPLRRPHLARLRGVILR
ncbi:hypothetical protein SUDANB105_07565 [Streptomyces sp. enrichment culture]|uniref:hypothetical protein n=1 Tax=Streptomyces sp. enrichment culture TaxID=1795815 RepID=UPI003F55BF42